MLFIHTEIAWECLVLATSSDWHRVQSGLVAVDVEREERCAEARSVLHHGRTGSSEIKTALSVDEA